MMDRYSEEEQTMLDTCIEHGMTEQDALIELVAYFRQGNRGPYTARIRAILGLP